MATRTKWQVPLKGGHEYDYLTRARKYHIRKPGDAKEAKQSYNRRVRRKAKISTIKEANDCYYRRHPLRLSPGQ